ncbi:MAG TPA: RNA polymerase sigma factor [Geobacteraceae bacterium]|nr:RNA polymerase sigma factor [Geobacteraceae bacterium]
MKEFPLESTEVLNSFLGGVERRAFKMAFLATGDSDEALDVVQDAMLAFVKRYAGRPSTEWGVLFHRTLQSRITDWYRRTSVRNRFRTWFGSADRDAEDENPLNNIPDPSSPDPARQLLNRAMGEAIEKALRVLPLRQQQAFLLRAWEGLDVAETAYAMGCSEGSVKTHYSRAVHTMRGLLEEFRP